MKLRSVPEDPEAVAAYGPLTDEGGARVFRMTLSGAAKDVQLARVEGITTREQAQALAGVRLYVDRAAFPDVVDEDEFYHADLLGLRAETAAGELFGIVKAVHEFGGGDVLEIQTESGVTELLPFTKACVPVVDVRGGRVLVEPPAVVEVRPQGQDDDDQDNDDRDTGGTEP